MATLLVEHQGRVLGGRVRGSLLIGRRASNAIVLDDPAVSRVHAWIAIRGNALVVADISSRTGTLINGERLRGRRTLSEGDVIQIGPATLKLVRDGKLPPGVRRVEWKREALTEGIDEVVRLACDCGTSIAVPLVYAGRDAFCKKCGKKLVVPTAAAELSPGIYERTDAPVCECAVCQSAVYAGEATSRCPACELVYHEECWRENRGCARYGCSEMALPEAPAEVGAASTGGTLDLGDEGRKWPIEFLLLGGSVLSLPISALTFGVPSAAMAATTLWARSRIRQRSVAMLAGGCAALGTLGGAAASYVWWMQGALSGVGR